MDELSPEAEAKDMKLVATRGEEEQGSEAQFSPPLGGNEAKRTLRRRARDASVASCWKTFWKQYSTSP